MRVDFQFTYQSHVQEACKHCATAFYLQHSDSLPVILYIPNINSHVQLQSTFTNIRSNVCENFSLGTY